MSLEPKEISRICRSFGFDAIHSVTTMTDGFANANYKVETNRGDFLLRLCRQNSRENIQYEIDLLNALKQIDFPAAYMIRNTQGGFISESDSGPVVLYEFKSGHKPELTEKTACETGRAIARLNLFDKWAEHPRKNSLHMEHCRELITAFTKAPIKYPDIFRYFEEQTIFLEEALSRPLPKGLIHGDVFPDNTIFNGSTLSAIIDFEEACTDTLLTDIAMGINGFCFIDNRLQPLLLKAFLSGYNRIRPMEDAEWELLPHYLQWAAHGMLSWHLRFYLIYREDAHQLKRARELMHRVIDLRNHQSTLTDTMESLHEHIATVSGNQRC